MLFPKVSIIIPVYNAEQYLREAIISAIDQTYKDTEIIIVDDGSSDQSLKIAQSIKDSKIRTISQPNKGGAAARNMALGLANGKYIKFLDADDVLLKDAIETQVVYMESLNKNELVFGDFNFINRGGKITQTNYFSEHELLASEPATFFLLNWKILISCPLHRRETLISIGGFDEKLPFGQESDLHFRLALEGIRFIYKSNLIFNYRSHLDENRISVIRTRNKNYLGDLADSLGKKIHLIKEKQGCLSIAQKEYFSLAFFGLARSSYIIGQKANGQHCLSLSKKHSKQGIPLFKGKRLYGFFYLIVGNIIGFIALESLLGKINKKSSKTNGELAILFKQ